MILNCFTINYFFLHFGNGYCVETVSYTHLTLPTT